MDKLTKVSLKAIIFNSEGKFLTIFRTETAPTHANTWDLPGGELEYGENTEQGLRREIEEETALAVENLALHDVDARIGKEDNIFWVSIAFKCLAKNNEVKLSWEHNDFKWVSPKEFLDLESSESLRIFVSKL
jgi:8-oxo-dGTP diphosphatase